MSSLIDSLCSWVRDAVSVVIPDLCTVCGRPLVEGEKVMCLHCLADLPLTGIRTAGHSVLHERVISTSTRIERAAALMWYFRESPYASLIHDAKYRSRPSVAEWLTEYFCRQLKADGFFDDIDMVMPVPMFPLKRFMRGYNQAEIIACTVARESGLKLCDNLVCFRPHSTQTRKNAAERYRNVRGSFKVRRPEELDGHHVLLTDDVLTTGATIRACFDTIRAAAPTARLSFLTLAATRLL